MPIGIGNASGTLPPFTYVPATGPTGVIPAAGAASGGGLPLPPKLNATGVLPPARVLPDRGVMALSNLAQQVRSRVKGSVMPRVPPGGGLNSALTNAIRAMDVISGMDQTLGKTRSIGLGTRRAPSQKIYDNFSAKSFHGPMSGRLGRVYA